ncbi:thiamine phosphate synthase [Halosquirtibacter laminarini]|uniref:Thiamine phosphate synthase n=1 Tax=Halosquirtibacter laminarini TaxID=3374600 RepID=A0AC61NIT5_9BACT|nr:thiamine phosphate synthase [Prolixibacteraceae bacterium]
MKWTVISPAQWLENEKELYAFLFSLGIDFIRIRKPNHRACDMNNFLTTIPKEIHHKCIVHHPECNMDPFPNIGIHRSQPQPNDLNNGRILSSNLHFIHELSKVTACDQVLVSPIFDSISKTNYHSQWNASTLSFIKEHNQIDWIALGGIAIGREQELLDMGFKHAALMGALWSNTIIGKDIHYGELKLRLKDILS